MFKQTIAALMAISHSDHIENFPSEELVLKAMAEARSQWSAKGFDAATCARLERRLNELAAHPTGRYILVNGGVNGYWTSYLTSIGCDSIRKKTEVRKFANDGRVSH